MKRCRDCGENKPASEFYVSRKADSGKTWLSSYCKPCHGARNVRQARARKYGLTPAEMDELLSSRSSCAICPYVFTDDDSRFLHIDHDHVTGKVRGVLCQWCNLLLGHAREDPVILRAAASYLERHTVGGAA